MTGKEQRILSSYHAIGAQKIRPDDGEDQNAVENMKKSVNFDLPELRHNVDLLLDQFEEELIANDRALKYHKNRVEVLKKEDLENVFHLEANCPTQSFKLHRIFKSRFTGKICT